MRRVVVASAMVVACSGGHAKPDAAVDAPLDAQPPGELEAALFPAVANRDVDLLFMIDNSSGMDDPQGRFFAAFPAFLSSLTALTGTLPNLHIGVVTSDLGTTAADGTQASDIAGGGGCHGSGESAHMQTSAMVNGPFIVDDDAGGGLRSVNFTGSLAATFIASASVGATGCGFEQPIESTRRVLSGNSTATGFLRQGAALAVIYLTNEDDCSLAHASLLDPDTSTLGVLGSFRCTHFGVACDGGGATPDDMNTPGAKTGCHSNDSGLYLTSVADYIRFFRSLESDPRNVMVAAIAGPTTPFTISTSSGNPYLVESCTYETANGTLGADSGVRLEQLVSAFRHRVFASACNTDYASTEAQIAEHIASMTGVPCLVRPLSTSRATCRAFDERADGTLTELPACGDSAAMPCFTLDEDAARCPDHQHLLANVHRSTPPPADTMVSVRCTL